MREESGSTAKIVGIAGASGSGKSYFAQALCEQLPVSSILLSQDDYYRDRSDISLAERQHINYDHPDALDFTLLVEQLALLKHGCAVECPQYDFTVHNRSSTTVKIAPAEIVILDGILIFAVQECRELIDFKVYVDTPLDLCFIRRLQRDVRERDRSVDSVIQQYLETVRPMFLHYVEPTAQYADCIVRGVENSQHYMTDVIKKIME
ncbi:uridine kinase [candidate division KSB1 bacterium]|nr:uridine kinase [candidate division KSB1 bacterium]RQW00197.1 MAG: uridine kinase [candidate division KSB1 bacterium]